MQTLPVPGSKAHRQESQQVQWARGDASGRMRLARSNNLCAAAVDILVEDSDMQVLEELAGNGRIGRSAQELLLKRGNHWVKKALAGNPSLTDWVAGELAQSVTLRYTLAGNPMLSALMQWEVLEREDVDELAELAGNARLDGEVSRALGQFLDTHRGETHWEDVRTRWMVNPACDPQSIQELLCSPYPEERALLMHNPRLTHEMHLQLADDGDPYVRSQVAEESWWVDVQALMSFDRDLDVLFALRDNRRLEVGGDFSVAWLEEFYPSYYHEKLGGVLAEWESLVEGWTGSLSSLLESIALLEVG